MSIISIELFKKESITRGTNTHATVHFLCDECQSICDRQIRPCQINAYILKQNHKKNIFCSKKCVKHSKQNNGKVMQAMQKTCIERYGVINPFASQIIVEKIKSIHLQRRGVTNPSKDPKIKEQKQISCMSTLGVKSPLQHPSIMEKLRKTCKATYGVECVLQRDDLKTKSKSKESHIKRHLTMKARNVYGNPTQPERILHSLLSELFDTNVEFHASLNGWDIDFFVPSIGLYIQVDGIYWHGLDRPRAMIESLANHNKRDAQILRRIYLDEKQNSWCLEHRIKFLRLTDIEIKSLTKESLNKVISKF